jgi:hypothetical protein
MPQTGITRVHAWLANLQGVSTDEDAGWSPRLIRAGARASLIKQLRIQGCWPPGDLTAYEILVANLIEGRDKDRFWGEEVECALRAYRTWLRERRRREYDHWDAIEQQNASRQGELQELARRTKRSAPAVDTENLSRVVEQAGRRHGRRAAFRQQRLHTPVHAGHKPKLRSIVDGWDPSRAQGRYPGAKGALLWLRLAMWKGVRTRVTGAAASTSVREDLAEMHLGLAGEAGKQGTAEQRKLVAEYERIYADEHHVSTFSKTRAMTRAMARAFGDRRVNTLESQITKAKSHDSLKK